MKSPYTFITMNDEETLKVRINMEAGKPNSGRTVGKLLPANDGQPGMWMYKADNTLAKHIEGRYKGNAYGRNVSDIESLRGTDSVWKDILDSFYWMGRLDAFLGAGMD